MSNKDNALKFCLVVIVGTSHCTPTRFFFVTYGKWSDFCAFDLTADLGEEDHFSLVKTGQRPSNSEISRGAAEHRDRRRLRRIRKRYRDRSQQERRLRLWSMNTVEIEWALRSC